MMPWNDYHNTAMAEIEATEDRVEETWDEAWALLLLLSGSLRATLVRAALGVDLDDRGAVRRFRTLAKRKTEEFERKALRGILGRATDTSLDPNAKTGAARGFQGESVRATYSRTTASWSRMRTRWETDSADLLDAVAKRLPPGIRPPSLEGPADRPGLTGPTRLVEIPGPEKVKLLEDLSKLTPEERARLGIPSGGDIDAARALLEGLEKGGEGLSLADAPAVKRAIDEALREDLEDVLNEADDNVYRNLLYDARRLVESTIGLTSRHSRRGSAKDVIAYLVGADEDARKVRPGGRKDGWRLNENNMRLSVTAHIRAMHRRAMVTQARALGIDHFMMDVPKRRHGKIAPAGLCGQQLWRVRTWGEWLEVQRRANAGRIASSAFDTLGLGYGDCTYLVPVPVVYLDQARAYGQKQRDRYMAAKPKPMRRPALSRAA